jgi:hypothetical protein
MGTIELRIESLAQLFDSLDPAPFHDKALDRSAERYILSSAGEHTSGEPLKLVLHGPPGLADHRDHIASAVHAHFALLLEAAERHNRQRMRIGRTALLLGVTVLGVSLLLRSLLPDDARAWWDAVREGLLILGWVALWRPVEILLFERFENLQERQRLRALATAGVVFGSDQPAGPGAADHQQQAG